MGDDLADAEVCLRVAQPDDVRDALVDEVEVRIGERLAGALDGEDDLAGEDVLGEGLLEEVVAADAVAAAGKEVDVVVLGLRVPVGGDEGQEDA